MTNHHNALNNDLLIWSHFIKAQRRLIKRLCSPIKILKPENKIDAKGLLKIEIDQTVNTKAINSLIKKHFPSINDEDIFLEKGYFLLDNDKLPSNKKLEEFALEAEKYYIDFNPYPTIEGVLTDTNSPFDEFKSLLNSKKIEIEFNKEGELLLPQEGIDIFDKQKNLQRDSKIGAIFPIKVGYDKFIENAVRNLLVKLQIPNDNYSIDPYEHKIYSNEAIFTKYCFSRLNMLIGLVMKNCILRIEVDQSSFQGNWQNCHLKDEIKSDNNGNHYFEYLTSKNKAVFEGEPINNADYFMLSYSTVLSYYEQSGIKKIGKKYIFEYNPHCKYFDSINKIQLDDNIWGKIREKLDLNTFWCNTQGNTISFDFENQAEFLHCYERIKSIEWIDIKNYKEKHKFKIKPIFPKRFEKVKSELSHKFKLIKYKENSYGNKLHIRYSYRLSESEHDAKLRFLNTLNEYSREGFKFVLDKQFKVKFIVEINKSLKEFEENIKFNKIRGAEIKYNENIIGTLKRAKFPFLDLQIHSDHIEDITKILSEEPQIFNKVEPILTGEIEKIVRLENTIRNLETEGRNLPNPNIVNFIFDSSKAKATENLSIFEETSAEWQELDQTKLSSNINKSQLHAVLTTLYSEELALIQGPPGTGKSTAISEIIWQHIRKKPNQKILLTSETHLAVDNAMDKLGSPLTNLVKPIRFGKEESLEEEGARFSLTRIQSWVEGNDTNPIINDNAISYWMNCINSRSLKNEVENEITIYLNAWRTALKNPNARIRTIFKNAYLDHVNVIGATCSSISERTSDNKFSTFFKNYCSVYHRDLYETLQSGITDKYINREINREISKIKVCFDVVIMDEASKATPPEFALPLLYGKKSIVVGDHRQLPPMLDENDFATTLEMLGETRLAQEFRKQDHNISHFEKLFLNPKISETIRASFNEQYRMHPQINDVIKQFYTQDRGLECGLDLSQVDDPNLNNPMSRYHGFYSEGFIGPQTHVVWVNVNDPEVLEGTSRVNFGEVEACKSILYKLTNADGFNEFQSHWKKLEDKEIGLISFYGRQLLYLQKETKHFEKIVPLRIRTVDRFQGMERNIVIVSMVRSNTISGTKDQEPDFIRYPVLGYANQDSLGFAEFPNRLNVALSRAKRLLIIVGNSSHFCKNSIYKNVFDTIANSEFGRVIEYKNILKT
jgi:superfamily I DNA and/or RNA helicase